MIFADELTAEDVRRLANRLTRHGLAPGTVTSCLNILSGLLRYGLKRKVVTHNVVRDLDRDDRPGAKRQSEPRYLTPDELDRLLVQMSETFRPVAATCAYAGLRVSEALGLGWRDVDLNAETISVAGQLGAAGDRLTTTKTSASAATVPMLPALRPELVAHRARQAGVNFALVRADALIFITVRGKPQSRRNALRAVHIAGDNAKLNGEGLEPVGLHDLRHSLVAIAFELGLSAPEVAVLARHANPSVTLAIYAGLAGNGRDRAVAKLSAGGFRKRHHVIPVDGSSVDGGEGASPQRTTPAGFEPAASRMSATVDGTAPNVALSLFPCRKTNACTAVMRPGRARG